MHGPLITDLGHRRPDRRIQSQRAAHGDARLARGAIQGVPQQLIDGRTTGDEGCEGGDGGHGVALLLLCVIVAAGGVGCWDCGCDGRDGGGFFVGVKGTGGVLPALFCGVGVIGRRKGNADAAAGAEGLVALASCFLCRFGRFGESVIAGYEDFDLDVCAGSTELSEGVGQLFGDPRGPGAAFDDPDELQAADGQSLGRGAVGDVEELGEDKCYAGGAGDQKDGVEGGEVGMGSTVWTIDEGCVRFWGCYGVLLGLG